jgi:Icc-related predicted phosphoesterase
MKIKVCHISDWHGYFTHLPWADMYCVTGDMLRNFIQYDRRYCEINKIPWINREREVFKQAEVVRKLKFRKYFGNPDAPVLIVSGNHDFVHLSNAFGGGPVYEFDAANYVFEVLGLRIGGFRGISAIVGDWNDEMSEEKLTAQVAKLPKDIDILMTHAPPHGILDKVGEYGRGPRVGIRALGSYLTAQGYEDGPLRLHMFGHIHEQFGTICLGTKERPMFFSNAATGYILYEVTEDSVTILESKGNSCR